jgi:hypothetical protein
VISIQNAEPTLALMGTEIQRRRHQRSLSIERKAPLSAQMMFSMARTTSLVGTRTTQMLCNVDWWVNGE